MPTPDDHAPPAPSRRRFLKRGVGGGGLLLLAGGLGVGLRRTRLGAPPRAPLRLLSLQEHAVLAAVAAAIVPGDDDDPGAAASWPSAGDVDVAGKIDALMARTHPETGADFRRLLRLFENAFVALVVSGSARPFTACDRAAQGARLRAWQRSRFGVLRSGYQALCRLCHAAYFSSPEVHPFIHYPGVTAPPPPSP